MSHGPCSVELTFDDATDARVREEWDALAARGFSSLAAHPGESNRPHITLLEAASAAAARALTDIDLVVPFAVTLGPPILFGSGDRRVLARSVIPSIELVELHAAVSAGCGETGTGWVPHVTLARRLKVASLAEALDLVAGEIDGSAVAVRSWNSVERQITVLSEPPPDGPPL